MWPTTAVQISGGAVVGRLQRGGLDGWGWRFLKQVGVVLVMMLSKSRPGSLATGEAERRRSPAAEAVGKAD